MSIYLSKYMAHKVTTTVDMMRVMIIMVYDSEVDEDDENDDNCDNSFVTAGPR